MDSLLVTNNTYMTKFSVRQSNPGVTLGGHMTCNGTGGGHLYQNVYPGTDYIYFESETYVTSFEMNAMPWEGNTQGNPTSVYINGYSGNESVWSTTVDLRDYTDWSDWLTVSVETAGLTEFQFIASRGDGGTNYVWPSIDNLVINEAPEPSVLALFGLGLIGLGFTRKKKLLD